MHPDTPGDAREGIGSAPDTATAAPAAPARRPSLDALTGVRFFAAMAVVLSHFAETGLVGVPARAVEFLDGGRTAVSLFFVLSGFVLAYNYAGLTGRTARWNYYVARIARICPVVVLALGVATVGMIYAQLHPELLTSWYGLKAPGIEGPAASLLAQLTMTTGWFPIAAINQPWNAPAWSISCEVFFYTLFPVLVVAAGRWTRRGVALVAVATWLVQGLWIAVVQALLPENRVGFVVSQFPLTHLAEFVLGIAACRLVIDPTIRRSIGRGPRAAALVTTLALLAALAWFVPFGPAFWLMTPLFAGLVAVLAMPTRARSWLALPVVVLLGEASYSLYLLHFPVIRAAQVAGVTPGIGGWVMLVVVVALSVLVFRTYETPLRRAIRRRACR